MKRVATIKVLTIIATALIGFSTLGFLAGTIVHEESHAVACLLLGAPIASWSWDHVEYVRSSNNYVNVLIGLAGGFGQALFSFIFLFYFRYLLVKFEPKIAFQKVILEKRLTIIPSIFFGLEIVLLGTALHGIANSVVEGFFYDVYVQIHGDTTLWLALLAACSILAAVALYKRQGKYLRM
jgi:hypothetical protein